MRCTTAEKLISNCSSAKEVLCIDIKNGAYPFLIPMELWNSHPEYKRFEFDDIQTEHLPKDQMQQVHQLV
jgi:hypothetical protein